MFHSHPRPNDLWSPWGDLWNGNLALAETIIAPDFVAHFAPMTPGTPEVQGPEGIKGMIRMLRGGFAQATFTMEVGPLAEDQLVAGRWRFHGVYQGGIPGSSADAVGKAVEFAGIDIFRVTDGKIVEYWLCSETQSLLQQVGVIKQTTDNKALWSPWGNIWNGDLALVEQVIAPDFVAHAAPITGTGSDEVHGREGLRAWVSGIRSAIPDLTFSTQIGPVSDGDMLVGRWQAQGVYRGGIPGVPTEAIGRQVHFSGTDSLRVVNGLLAEYWANADSLLFMQQLSAVPLHT